MFKKFKYTMLIRGYLVLYPLVTILSLLCIKITYGEYIASALTAVLWGVLIIIDHRPQKTLLSSEFRQTSIICVGVILFIIVGVYEPDWNLGWFNALINLYCLTFWFECFKRLHMAKTENWDELNTAKKVSEFKYGHVAQKVKSSDIKPLKK